MRDQGGQNDPDGPGSAADPADSARLLAEARQRIADLEQRIIVQEKMASLGILTAGIAHEIKNPLNFINNFAALSRDIMSELEETLHSGAGPEDFLEANKDNLEYLRSNLAKILEHGRRAERIVHSMLRHAGPAGSVEPCDVNRLLEESQELAYHGMRVLRPGFFVTVHRHYAEGLPEIQAGPRELSRVFLNIINNAFYSLAEKSRELGAGFSPELSLTTAALPNDLEIRIRDNGQGMAGATAQRIFQPFFTTKPDGEGVGLGLSMSYEVIVDQHHGTLAVESAAGEFAEFVIRLPWSGAARKNVTNASV